MGALVSSKGRRFRYSCVRGFIYPAALEAFEGFYDSSYGNDVTDSLCLIAAGRPLCIWIEHHERAERSVEFGWSPELPVGPNNVPPPRFTVMPITDGEPSRSRAASLQDLLNERYLADCESIFESDDPDALLHFLSTMEPR